MENEESTNNRKRPGEPESVAEKRARLDKRNETEQEEEKKHMPRRK